MQVSVSYFCRLEIFTHFFAVIPLELRVTNAIFEFAYRFVETEWKYDFKLGKNIKVIGKVWGGRLEDNKMFRFPISLYPDFIQFLKSRGVQDHLVQTVNHIVYKPMPAVFKLADQYILRDYQEEAKTFANNQYQSGLPSALLQMPTGTGKTVTLLSFAADLGLRMGIVIAPGYIDKWAIDCKTYLGVDADKIYEIRGSKSIRKLFKLVEDNDYDYDITLFSLRTLTEFFKEYEKSPEACIDSYGGTPMELWRATKIGFLGGDEMHEQLFAVYWMQTFIHGPFHLGLSATMLHSDPFIEKMQKIIYPQTIRFDKIKMKRYIHAVNVAYRFDSFDNDRIKTSFPRKSTYSQNAYEASVLKNRKVLINFLKMVHEMTEVYFMEKKRPGDKLGIYCARIEMLNSVVGYLKNKYPKLDIRRYAEDDDYQDVLDADVRVTTRGSAGTAVDIPNLTCLISIDNVDSSQANLQLLGRLRDIPGREVTYVQMFCRNIKKHISYKEHRDELFRDRVKGIAEHIYPNQL